MPGAMHRMGVYLGLVEDEDYVEAGDGYGHSAERAPARREEYAEARYSRDTHHGRAVEVSQRDYEETENYANAGYEAPVPTYQITALHPRTYNEAKTIGLQFRAGTPVIMNLSEMDDADAKRLVDFAAGLVFATRGTIERVTQKVFLLSPPNVTVAAEEKQRLVEGGFFNQS